jgi:hypothetical protein
MARRSSCPEAPARADLVWKPGSAALIIKGEISMLKTVMIAGLMLGLMLPAHAIDICNTMTQQQANQSPQCVRWYFTCKAQLGKKPTAGPGAMLDERTRYRLILDIAFSEAQVSCETFSYQEALAAAQVLMLLVAPSPSLSPGSR